VPVVLAGPEEPVELLLDPAKDAAAILFLSIALIRSAIVAVHRASFILKHDITTAFRTARP
jgi:hypothetical protein